MNAKQKKIDSLEKECTHSMIEFVVYSSLAQEMLMCQAKTTTASDGKRN